MFRRPLRPLSRHWGLLGPVLEASGPAEDFGASGTSCRWGSYRPIHPRNIQMHPTLLPTFWSKDELT